MYYKVEGKYHSGDPFTLYVKADLPNVNTDDVTAYAEDCGFDFDEVKTFGAFSYISEDDFNAITPNEYIDCKSFVAYSDESGFHVLKRQRLQPKRVFIAFYKNVKNGKRKLAYLREARVFEIIDNKPSFVLSFEYSAGMSMGEDTEIMYHLIDAGIIKDKKEGYYFDKERDYHIYCLN